MVSFITVLRRIAGLTALAMLVAPLVWPGCRIAPGADDARPGELMPGLPYRKPAVIFLPTAAVLEGREINVATAGFR